MTKKWDRNYVKKRDTNYDKKVGQKVVNRWISRDLQIQM